MTRFRLLLVLAALLPFVTTGAARAESAAVALVSISDLSVKEGDSGTTTFEAEVRLSNWYQPVVVELAAYADTAGANDYSFTPVRLTLTPGGPSQKVSGVITGDLVFEGEEIFQLRATSPISYYVQSVGGRITILDDDAARASRLRIQGLSVPEGQAGIHAVQVDVHLEPAAQAPVTVTYGSRDLTAYANDGDYRPASGTVSFAPGETVKSITVDVVGDTVWEAEEAFALSLGQPRGALVAGTEARIVIANDDAPSVITIDDLRVAEGHAGTKTVTVTARYDRPTPPMSKLAVSVLGGSARANEDFAPVAETLYPGNGATSISFDLTIFSDTTPECDEGVIIQYVARYTGDDTMKTARLIIADDDSSAPRTDCPDLFTPSTPAPAPDGGATTTKDPIRPPPDGGATTGTQADGGPPDGSTHEDGGPGTPPALSSNGGCAFSGTPPSGALALLGPALAMAAILLRHRRRTRPPAPIRS